MEFSANRGDAEASRRYVHQIVGAHVEGREAGIYEER